MLFRRGRDGSPPCPAYGSKESIGFVSAREEKVPALLRVGKMDG